MAIELKEYIGFEPTINEDDRIVIEQEDTEITTEDDAQATNENETE